MIVSSTYLFLNYFCLFKFIKKLVNSYHIGNFQNGLCGWELSGAINDDMFAWNRTNGKLLGDNGLEGPTFDHTQNENGM